MTKAALLLMLVALACVTACKDDTPLRCESDPDCSQAGIPGTCRASPTSDESFCSFPDDTCPAPASQRWGILAGDGLASTCVLGGSDLDGGTDSAVGSIDASTDGAPALVEYFEQHGGGAGAESVAAVVQASDGSVIVVGAFNGATNLGGAPTTSAGLNDAYILKLEPDGSHAWDHRFGGTGGDFATAAAVDADGNPVFVGTFNGSVDFGCGAENGGSSERSFLVKYSSAGSCLWSTSFESSVRGVAVDAAGDVYVTGGFEGIGNFGGAALSSAGDFDVFVAKFAGANGAGIWSERFGAGASDRGTSIAVAGDQVVMVGHFSGTVSFGGTPLVNTIVGGFVVKLAASTGAHVWSRQIAKSPDNSIQFNDLVSVDLGSDGSVYVCGDFGATTDLGGGAVTSAGFDDVFVAKYASSTGAHTWSRRLGGDQVDFCRDLTVLDDGRVIAVGQFRGTADFGAATLVSLGDHDGFVVALSALGVPELALALGSAGPDHASSVASGAVPVVAGSFSGSVDFGDLGGIATSSGSDDVFLIRHSLP